MSSVNLGSGKSFMTRKRVMRLGRGKAGGHCGRFLGRSVAQISVMQKVSPRLRLEDAKGQSTGESGC